MRGKTFFPVIFLALLLAACAARGSAGAFEHSFSLPGRGGLHFGVDRSLALLSEGRLAVQAPTDVVLPTNASFHYALYGESEPDQPGGHTRSQTRRHVHCIWSRLDKKNWRWEKESNALIAALSYNKQTAGGRNWTVQVLPVTGAGDWFDALWQGLGKETPEFWLARRWSATPEDDIRLVVEYREEAPQCMQAALRAAEEDKKTNKNYAPLRGNNLQRLCREEVEAFNSRAAAALFFDEKPSEAPGPAVTRATARPAFAPDMGRLVGRAEIVTKDVGGIRP